MTKATNKYFEHYAESEVSSLSQFPTNFVFEYAIVIPAYKEPPSFVERLRKNQARQHACLFVLVINQPNSDKSTRLQIALHDYVLSIGAVMWQSPESKQSDTGSMSLVQIADTRSAVLIVDRYRVPIACEEGVGKARKIGADIACFLFNKQQILSPYLHSTDADASLPENYLTATNALKKDDVACCYNFFHHSPIEEVNSANQQYELALKYYVAGLRYAQSPYAFFTIGSVIAIRFDAYIAVRGFPKKSAGEDFYLLNKVAKLGHIAWLSDATIKLEARESDRVPFGTGPAVSKIIALMRNDEAYCYYHPRVFELLREAYQVLPEIVAHRHDIEQCLQQLPSILQKAFESIGFIGFLKKQMSASDEQFLRQFHVWFDAFKTLKLIHTIRDLDFADIPLKQALLDAPFKVVH